MKQARIQSTQRPRRTDDPALRQGYRDPVIWAARKAAARNEQRSTRNG